MINLWHIDGEMYNKICYQPRKPLTEKRKKKRKNFVIELEQEHDADSKQ